MWALDRVLAGPLRGPAPGAETPPVLTVGLLAAAPGLAFLWGCTAAAARLKARPLRAGAVCAGLAIVTSLAEDALLGLALNLPVLDGWDLLAVGLLAVLAAVLLWLDGRGRRED